MICGLLGSISGETSQVVKVKAGPLSALQKQKAEENHSHPVQFARVLPYGQALAQARVFNKGQI